MRRFLRNTLAPSPLLPRVVRTLLYRALGMRIASWRISPHCYFGGREITIGARAFVNRGCFFDLCAPIEIGRRCHLAQQVMLLTSSHLMGPSSQRAGQLDSKRIVIDDGCWVGARVTILPGVRIGPGCVIATGAVVTRDCEPNGLYAGVPARRLRDLADRNAHDEPELAYREAESNPLATQSS
jgi:maltose O-acetyltransferase